MFPLINLLHDLEKVYFFIEKSNPLLLSYLKMVPMCLICADDLILLNEASMDQADATRDYLDPFYMSGH